MSLGLSFAAGVVGAVMWIWGFVVGLSIGRKTAAPPEPREVSESEACEMIFGVKPGLESKEKGKT